MPSYKMLKYTKQMNTEVHFLGGWQTFSFQFIIDDKLKHLKSNSGRGYVYPETSLFNRPRIYDLRRHSLSINNNRILPTLFYF